MADEKQQATTNSALPFGSEAKQSKAFHSLRESGCAHGALLLVSSTLISTIRMNTTHVVAWAATDTMAALIRHGLFKTADHFSPKNLVRLYAVKAKKPNPDKKIPPKIHSTAESLAAKGFLRSQKAYNPPQDVSNRFKQICQTILGSNNSNFNSTTKFALLTACQKEFDHAVPNSLLHTMETTSDVLEFYKTPINTNVPLDMMKNIDLPENLHIQYEYNRFHPETDAMFNGVTAFPRSSTLVTGLKYKDKYPGHEARTTWPYNT